MQLANSRLKIENYHLEREYDQLQLANGRLQNEIDHFRRAIVIFKWQLVDFKLEMNISNCNGKLQMEIVSLQLKNGHLPIAIFIRNEELGRPPIARTV